MFWGYRVWFIEAMESGAGSLEARPGVLVVGAPGVGKRTILSRLLAAEIPDTHDLSSGVLCQGYVTVLAQFISLNELQYLEK